MESKVLVVHLLLMGIKTRTKRERLKVHVRGSNSAHNQAMSKCEALLKQYQHIQTFSQDI